MKLVDPEQRLRVIKISLVLSVAIVLSVSGFAYFYQYIWPKKRAPIFSFGTACSPENEMVRTMADPGVPLPDPAAITVPALFRSTKDIRSFFAKQGLPTESKEVHASQLYFFVLAYPYSGVDSAHFYCFVQRTNTWVRFFQSGLANMNRGPVNFTPNGPYINITQNGQVVMTLNPPAN